MKLREKDFPTLLPLMESYMNIDSNAEKVIPHLIEEVRYFKAFVATYIANDGDEFIGHMKGQQFKFSILDREPIMQYKILCMDQIRKLAIEIKLRRVDAT